MDFGWGEGATEGACGVPLNWQLGSLGTRQPRGDPT